MHDLRGYTRTTKNVHEVFDIGINSGVCSVMQEIAETRNSEKQTEPNEESHSETSRNGTRRNTVKWR